jgi:hypothetical protein
VDSWTPWLLYPRQALGGPRGGGDALEERKCYLVRSGNRITVLHNYPARNLCHNTSRLEKVGYRDDRNGVARET